MQKNPFQISTYEYGYICLAVLAVLLVGNAKVLLQHFGLIGSSAIVGDHVSNTVGSGLRALDTLNATPNIVTFITWGVVGLVLFSVVQAFARASDTIGREREVSSNRFVHPANFNRKKYWRTISLNAFLSFGLTILLLIVGLVYVLFVIPIASLYLQRFLIVSGAGRLLDLALSFFIAAAGTLAFYWVLKATLWHHNATQG